MENLGDDFMNKKQKWDHIINEHDGFLIDIKFDFNKLSKYGFNISDGEFASFDIIQGHISEHILIYKNIRRPMWIDMMSPREKQSEGIIRRMYNDGILEPMKWDTYTTWRKDNCNEHNILNKR